MTEKSKKIKFGRSAIAKTTALGGQSELMHVRSAGKSDIGGRRKIVVGMSGGVDSSMALILLKEQGFDPIGLSLKYSTWSSSKNLIKENICCSVESFNIAKSICKKLNVPHYILDASKEFNKEVINYFVFEFKKKRTPNPCVMCNRFLKFEKLFEFAKKKGAKYVATGHYAKTEQNPKTKLCELKKAKDREKDQTYFLSFLKQNQLKNIIFPLDGYLKGDIFKMAEKYGFNYFTKDGQSQDFCFIENKSLSSFFEEKIGKKPGEIIDTSGNVLGGHDGLHFFTIGQRKGINLPYGPFYVKEFDIKNNALIITKNKKEISAKELILSPFNFISGKAPKTKIRVMANIRYGQPTISAILYPPKAGKIKIVFEKEVFAPTPGQFCVFYQGTVCLGGGAIV